jgi:hypothetical protein
MSSGSASSVYMQLMAMLVGGFLMAGAILLVAWVHDWLQRRREDAIR